MGRVKAFGAVAIAAVLVSAGLAGCNRNEASQPARTQTSGGASSSTNGGSAGASSAGSYNDRGGSDGGGYRSDRGGGYGDRGGSERGGYNGNSGAGYGGGRYANDNASRPREPTPDFKGKPMWSDNRSHSAKENAQYHFERDGADLGAKTLDEYLTKVHDFVDHPPSGVETLTRRNGDKLIYDSKTNMFAVARRDGAPRTAFKPRDGADYWKKQQARAEDEKNGRGGGYGGGQRRSSRSERDDG